MTIELNPTPVKIPDRLQNDPELSNYFKELTNSVYQLWFGLNGNKVPSLISTTESIDVTTTGSTELFKVPANKSFIPLYIVIRVNSFTSGGKSTQAVASFGGNGATYDDFLNSVTYTVAAQDTFQIDRPDDATELAIQSSDDSFRIIIETASDATTEGWAVDLFGYLV